MSRLMKTLSAAWLMIALSVCAAPAQDTADEAVRNVLEGLQENRPQVIWQSLPASYQEDLRGLIHDFAAQADAELWNLTFGVLNKSVRVLDEKREYIFEHPMVSGQLEKTPQPDAAYDAVLAVLLTFTQSELADINRLRQLDPEAFLAGTVSRLMEQIRELSEVVPDIQVPDAELSETTIELVSSEGDKAVVRIETEGESSERNFVRVEGKWVPEEMAAEWDEKIAEARSGLAELSEMQRSPETEQVAETMRSVEGVLDQLLQAETEENFNNALQQLVGMVMFQVMGMAPEESESDQE